MSETAVLLQHRIRDRAYELWQAAGEPQGKADQFWQQAEQEIRAGEAGYDKTLADSFPASDPPANSGITD
jgi:hypothetical protein